MADKTSTAKVVDFTNVKESSGFNKKRMPAGDYEAKIISVEDAPSKKDQVHQWLYAIQPTADKYDNRTFPHYCKLQENQLWKLRNLFLAAGIAVPKKKMKLDPSRIVGRIIGITLDDDEYEGKEQSVITATFPASELEGSDEDEDDDTEDGDEDDDDEEEEEPAPPARKAAKKKPAPAPVDDEDEDEEDEADADDEDDEDEEPAPPAKAKKKPAKKAAARIPGQRKTSPEPQVADEELEELDLEEI